MAEANYISHNDLTISTYNILANNLATLFGGESIEQAMDRYKLVINTIGTDPADIICLQEVDNLFLQCLDYKRFGKLSSHQDHPIYSTPQRQYIVDNYEIWQYIMSPGAGLYLVILYRKDKFISSNSDKLQNTIQTYYNLESGNFSPEFAGASRTPFRGNVHLLQVIGSNKQFIVCNAHSSGQEKYRINFEKMMKTLSDIINPDIPIIVIGDLYDSSKAFDNISKKIPMQQVELDGISNTSVSYWKYKDIGNKNNLIYTGQIAKNQSDQMHHCNKISAQFLNAVPVDGFSANTFAPYRYVYKTIDGQFATFSAFIANEEAQLH